MRDFTELSPRQAVALVLGLAALYAAWALGSTPWFGFYEHNPDEGFNLSKAALVANGYALYRDIWSDQPPVFTYALTLVHQVAPWSVAAARLLVLGFACLLIASLFVLVERRHGWRTALWAALLLMLAPMFVELSVSVMIGLPSIALATAALALASRPARGRKAWIAMSLAGLLYALSLQTKLFSAVMAPAIAAVIVLNPDAACWKQRLRNLGVFALGVALGMLLVVWLAGEAFIDQLIRPHAATALRERYSLGQSAQVIWAVLKAQPVLLGLGLAGVLHAGRRLWRGDLRPLAVWLIVPAGALLLHVPVWDHQVLLLFPPLAWLGGVALERWCSWLSARFPARNAPWALGMAALLIATGVPLVRQQVVPEDNLGSKLAIDEAVGRFAGLGGWVMADTPMDAYRNRLLVPPELAVYSLKRIMVRQLTTPYVMESLRRRRPLQVSLRRFAPNAELLQYLERHYLRTTSGPQFVHYVARPDMLPAQAHPELEGLLDHLTQAIAATGVDGGYASAATPDGQQRYGESRKQLLTPEQVWMDPPGSTPRVGACFLRSYQLTGQAPYLERARQTAQAIMRAQSCAGGWPAAAQAPGTCQSRAVSPKARLKFDEGLNAEAIDYLLDAAIQLPQEQDGLRAAAARALDFLVATQNAQGAWPYDLYSQAPYARHSTLNDDLTTAHLRVLLRGWRTFGRADYRQAVEKGVEFLLKAQSAQGGWAQQYDQNLAPAPGRTFEPAALATLETAYAIRTLTEIDRQWPNPRIKAAIARGGNWLLRSAQRPGHWARFHDLRDGHALYLDRAGKTYARWQDLPAEQRDSYRWEESFAEVSDALALARTHVEGNAAAFDAMTQRLQSLADIAGYARARLQLGASLGQGHMPRVDAAGLVATASLIDQCRMLQAAWTVAPRRSATDDR